MNYLEAGKNIIKTLNDAGYEAYFVGGMVRDYLLKGDVHDIDIATNALPDEVMALFPQTHPVGIKFGMVLVISNGFSFEVTTFRSDGKYDDNRHPTEVKFERDLINDTKRRDFTINGMALDINFHLFDYNDGLTDLKNGIIRAIGNPYERFTEDSLRIIRAIYFVSKLGFTIEAETLRSMIELKDLLKNIKIERIYQELKKMAAGAYFNRALKILDETKISAYLPDLERGIHYLASNDLSCDLDTLFVLSFKLNEEMSEAWRLSTNDYNRYQMALDLALAVEDGQYNPLHVYANKKENCLLANKVNSLLGYKDSLDLIIRIDNELPIHKTCDLKFKGQDIMMMTKKEPSEWLGDLVDDIKYKVIMGELPNDYQAIKNYVSEILRIEGVLNEK